MYSIARAFVSAVAVIATAKLAEAQEFILGGGGGLNFYQQQPNSSPLTCNFTRSACGACLPVQTVTLLANGYIPDNSSFPAFGSFNVSTFDYTSITYSPSPLSFEALAGDSYADESQPGIIAKCYLEGYSSGNPPSIYVDGTYQAAGGGNIINFDLSTGAKTCSFRQTPCIGLDTTPYNLSLYSVGYNPDPGAFPVDGTIVITPGEITEITLSDKSAQSGQLSSVAMSVEKFINTPCPSWLVFMCQPENSKSEQVDASLLDL